MIFNVLSYHFIKVFSNDKSFITNTTHNARNQYHIIFLLFTILGIENNLNYLFWYTK